MGQVDWRRGGSKAQQLPVCLGGSSAISAMDACMQSLCTAEAARLRAIASRPKWRTATATAGACALLGGAAARRPPPARAPHILQHPILLLFFLEIGSPAGNGLTSSPGDCLVPCISAAPKPLLLTLLLAAPACPAFLLLPGRAAM